MKLVSLAAALLAVAVQPMPALAQPAAPTHDRPSAFPKAVVKASASEVTEGDRLTVRVRVPRAGLAKKVVLQERRTTILGDVVWEDVTTRRARSRVKFVETVTSLNTASYRVAVSYRGRVKPVVSRATSVKVWRWVPLHEFAPYFQTSQATYGESEINGVRYEVWGGLYSYSTRSWEARVTPGRHCMRFRATLGLADTSDDGSTGTIAFTTDESATVYQSPALTPGMTLPVELALPSPYRFGMQAANTSAEKVKAFPMVGNGAFYCTGIE
ncbi:hypothetical protein KDN32_20255 [Nocardioides sp. J2M5]|uniref:hypothetical protein n=1 Tax=Nocardioides palaemonis TaxID=2829810 RepID=UPI001BA7B271|nr:hypothetical protein [Nocardioides palaemonis]MBS2940075.1 hypothetical protein [Nocardioides palaemonis]